MLLKRFNKMEFFGFLFIGGMFFLLLILIISLGWTIIDFENSFFYSFSKDTNMYSIFELSQKEMDIWAVRGQIGDILAGHFSALAFIGIAISLYLQNNSNKQMQESIRIQREEAFISNMNIRLDRYYKILDENLEIVTSTFFDDYINAKSTIEKWKNRTPSADIKTKIRRKVILIKINEPQIKNIIMILNLIYDEIGILQKDYDTSYKRYRQELKLRLELDKVFLKIKNSFTGADKCKAFSLLDEEK